MVVIENQFSPSTNTGWPKKLAPFFTPQLYQILTDFHNSMSESGENL